MPAKETLAKLVPVKAQVTKDRSPWDRQPGETASAHGCFLVYRDMPYPRSIAGAARAIGRKSFRRLEMWSSRFDWPARAAAWDEELDRKYAYMKGNEIEAMAKRHTRIARAMQAAGAKEIRALLEKVEAAERELAETQKTSNTPVVREPVLNVTEIVKLVTHGTNLERLAMGEPTEHTRNDGDSAIDYSALTPEERKTLYRLVTKAKK